MYYYSPFRKSYTPEQEAGCPFCDSSKIEQQIICRNDGTAYENEHWYWIVNLYPKFEGHTMLVPKHHFSDFTSETNNEAVSRLALIKEILPLILKVFPEAGIEYFAQTGSGSESSVPHLHWHLVPASPNDDLRSFGKLGHFYTTKPDEEKVLIYPKEITMSPEVLRQRLSKTS